MPGICGSFVESDPFSLAAATDLELHPNSTAEALLTLDDGHAARAKEIEVGGGAVTVRLTVALAEPCPLVIL